MQSKIFQISTDKFTEDNSINIDNIAQGDGCEVEYTYELTEEQRKEAIKDITTCLPNGMVTFNEDDDTLTYNGGFEAWLKEYVLTIRRMAADVDENNAMYWYSGTAINLQRYIENPLDIEYRFIVDDDISADRSRSLMCLLQDMDKGDKIYFGAVCGYKG